MISVQLLPASLNCETDYLNIVEPDLLPESTISLNHEPFVERNNNI